MVFRSLSVLATLFACQGHSASSDLPTGPAAIEVRDRTGKLTARVIAGHPCRATVDGLELLVGGRPLIAQVGETRWTGEDAPNGTTLKKNDAAVARIHAKQLFDAEGVPLVRVMENGDIGDSAGRIVRKAVLGSGTPPKIEIGEVTVTGTADLALAAMLTASEAGAEIRALAACNYLLPAEKL